MSDKKFIDGLLVKAPRGNAPEYVVGHLSLKREELITWLQQQNGEWVNVDLKIANSGKWYAQVDDWKPDRQRGSGSGSGGRQQAQRPQSPEQQYDQVREQRLRDHQRNTPVDDFGDDIPF